MATNYYVLPSSRSRPTQPSTTVIPPNYSVSHSSRSEPIQPSSTARPPNYSVSPSSRSGPSQRCCILVVDENDPLLARIVCTRDNQDRAASHVGPIENYLRFPLSIPVSLPVSLPLPLPQASSAESTESVTEEPGEKNSGDCEESDELGLVRYIWKPWEPWSPGGRLGWDGSVNYVPPTSIDLDREEEAYSSLKWQAGIKSEAGIARAYMRLLPYQRAGLSEPKNGNPFGLSSMDLSSIESSIRIDLAVLLVKLRIINDISTIIAIRDNFENRLPRELIGLICQHTVGELVASVPNFVQGNQQRFKDFSTVLMADAWQLFFIQTRFHKFDWVEKLLGNEDVKAAAWSGRYATKFHLDAWKSSPQALLLLKEIKDEYEDFFNNPSGPGRFRSAAASTNTNSTQAEDQGFEPEVEALLTRISGPMRMTYGMV